MLLILYSACGGKDLGISFAAANADVVMLNKWGVQSHAEFMRIVSSNQMTRWYLTYWFICSKKGDIPSLETKFKIVKKKIGGVERSGLFFTFWDKMVLWDFKQTHPIPYLCTFQNIWSKQRGMKIKGSRGSKCRTFLMSNDIAKLKSLFKEFNQIM